MTAKAAAEGVTLSGVQNGHETAYGHNSGESRERRAPKVLRDFIPVEISNLSGKRTGLAKGNTRYAWMHTYMNRQPQYFLRKESLSAAVFL